MKPIFTIITATLNRPQYLKKCIESVQKQSFYSFEHIIVNDGDDDNILDIIESFNDSRIKYFKNKSTQGAPFSYNKGIKNSSGKYICFLGDDDEYYPDYLISVLTLFEKAENQIGFVWTGIKKVFDDGNKLSDLYSVKWPEKFSTLEEGLAVATGIGNGYGVSVQKRCCNEIGIYDEKLPVSSDTDFLIRLAQNYQFRTVPEVLVKIRQHNKNQLTNFQNHELRHQCYTKIFEKHKLFLMASKKVLYAHSKSYAGLSYYLGKKTEGRKTFLKLLLKYPINLIYYADLICFEMHGKHFYQWKRDRRKKKA